jgi:hypothetical protein
MSKILASVLVSIVWPMLGQSDILLQSGKLLPGTRAAVVEPRAAACAPATGLRELEWNNINALIETGGSMWQDRATGRSHYFAPKSGNVSVLFAGSLWLGGLSPDQQLKLAAVQYRYGGNDYWPGPLTNDGSAEVSPATCLEWDKFFISFRADAERHRQYFECLDDPECENTENGYGIPPYFLEYPAHGNVSSGQDYYLAPFYDFDNDGFYNPETGDYPWYDFLREIDCASRRREDIVPLFGDQTYYWIFNDKGNIHSESLGQPIGMEVRAQAFAFSTNDEINNMTFYNYVLINQGTQTLQDTYFGTWIDCDIGGHVDDYVGCDVRRGLGYGYNGNAFDEASNLSPGYGSNPPAVGVDFFEGPYQDEDGVDNPLTEDINAAVELQGIPYKGIGIGYGDGIVDNERYGMRKFLYHISGSALNGPPEIAVHYYNYMQGFWKNGQRMAYGGNALTPGSGANLSIAADYMFPGDSDPLNFGTLGVDVDPWTEVSSNNPPGDRRFMQSAGPFTLEPGDYNNITVGVVYGRSFQGDPFASVELVRSADDKAQALFDNCFELISGPDAPDVSVRESDREIILYLSNENPLSSNYREGYSLVDPTVPEVIGNDTISDAERSYKFQGYMVYQLVNDEVSSADLNDIEKARLIAQCDIQDGVGRLINYNKSPETNLITPQLMVDAADEGLRHSFRITTDAFAAGDSRLINFKTYYFMAIAYGHNEYEPYNISTGVGQDEPFIASRKATFGSIPVVAAVPHKVNPEGAGTVWGASYGDRIPLTRIEGRGNGEANLELTREAENNILENAAFEGVHYTADGSPVEVRVVDPLRLVASDFELRLAPVDDRPNGDSAFWEVKDVLSGEVYSADQTIRVKTEALILSLGLSVDWHQYQREDVTAIHFKDPLESELVFEDPSQPWLLGFPDNDGLTPFNWILSGTSVAGDEATEFDQGYDDYRDGPVMPLAGNRQFTDPQEKYERLIGGTWAPYCLVSYSDYVDPDSTPVNLVAPTIKNMRGDQSPLSYAYASNLIGLNNVDVVITSDKSKWTRCPVFEMQMNRSLSEGNKSKMQFRAAASVDKNGLSSGTLGCNESEATLNGEQPFGMSWFPGYAMDITTGKRLNMAFGEDSWQTGENGRDMLWNPGSTYVSSTGAVLAGGQHWVYVFRDTRHELNEPDYMPAYDEARFMYSRVVNGNLLQSGLRTILSSCTWVGSAMMNPEFSWKPVSQGLVPSSVRIRLRVTDIYEKYSQTQTDVSNTNGAQNNWNPLYTFSTRGRGADIGNPQVLSDALSLINIVPNPYYAFSTYESSKLDNRVKIINLPPECEIGIYDMNGALIRLYRKADPLTWLDWDLKNFRNIPVASGCYIVHIRIPGVGEKVLKWFGVMRPVDLNNF